MGGPKPRPSVNATEDTWLEAIKELGGPERRHVVGVEVWLEEVCSLVDEWLGVDITLKSKETTDGRSTDGI